MFELGAPYWLLLVPIVVLPWLSGRPRVAFSSLRLVVTGASLRAALAWIPPLLASVGLGLLVVAMARPQRVDRELIVERDGVDIMLVLDVSGSMEQTDYELGGRPISRLAIAREVIADFVEGRPEDRTGLVIFGEEALTSVPLTLDNQGMAAYLRQIQAGMAGKKATAVGDAIAIAAQRLKDLDAPSRLMILVTDGRSNAGQLGPIDAAQAAAALGIRIYTVGIGGDGRSQGGLFGSLFQAASRSELDEETLQQIADISDAEYFRAKDTQALRQVYDTIDEMEKTTAEVAEFVHREERFALPAWLGLLALLLSVTLSETWLRRLP
ncbi:MAG: VWA domain-containing protein [Myxococcota bacterium]